MLAGKSKKFSTGTVQILFDLTMVTLAAITSFALLGQLEGVREGSLAAALGVGFVIRMIGGLRRYLRNRPSRD